ncbi:hypothetical protein CHS0354_009934 [Potamilus streckersoni]|uniref:EF-hand domain-containing protein n=1 Tax=Potamilus streckersoni TaxID=2493646 RepID=A0AAE0TDM1_9BIVA|nr:hypothetical protein CHS0354_009934 [Potamilus streckersoni]
MSAEHRMSVKEKIEQLERSKSELHPPIFDSRKDIVTNKRSCTTSPDGQINKTHLVNSIKVIETQRERVDNRALIEADEHFASLGKRGERNRDEEVSTMEQVSINISLQRQRKDERKSPVVGVENKMDIESVEIVPFNEMGQANNNVMTTQNDNKIFENGEVSLTKSDEFTSIDPEKSKENGAEEIGEISHEAINDDNTRKEDDNDNEIEYDCPRPMTEEEEMAILEQFSNADPKHLQYCLSFFRSMDKERYGYITIQHFSYAVKTIRPFMKDREIVEIFVDLDANHDGLVSLEEFLTEMMKPKIVDEQELMNVFDGMDKDKDGFLSASDLKSSFEEDGFILTDFDTQTILKHGHHEKNKLTFKEFCRWSGK